MAYPYADDEQQPRRRSSGSMPDLGANVGPLPLWGWAVVAVASVFIYRRLLSPTKTAAQAVSGVTAPAYSPQTGGVYLLPSTSAPGGTGTTPAPPPAFAPNYPASGQGKAPAGTQCQPGRVLIQGPNGYTCATSDEAIALGKFLATVPTPGK